MRPSHPGWVWAMAVPATALRHVRLIASDTWPIPQRGYSLYQRGGVSLRHPSQQVPPAACGSVRTPMRRGRALCNLDQGILSSVPCEQTGRSAQLLQAARAADEPMDDLEAGRDAEYAHVDGGSVRHSPAAVLAVDGDKISVQPKHGAVMSLADGPYYRGSPHIDASGMTLPTARGTVRPVQACAAGPCAAGVCLDALRDGAWPPALPLSSAKGNTVPVLYEGRV
jgi:hypothetical protein